MAVIQMAVIQATCEFGEMHMVEENLGAAREAEYEYRHKPFEQRLAAIVLAAVYGKVPRSLTLTYPPKVSDEENF